MANNNKKRSEGFTAAQRLINEMVANRTVGTDYNRSSSRNTSDNAATTQSSPEAYVTKRLSQLGLDRKEVNDDFVISFINDSRRYADEGANLNSRIGVGTSSSIYNSRKETAEDLRSRSWAISRYLEQNKESIPEENYAALKSYLDNFDQYASQSLYSTYRTDKFYSQFDSEEAYDKWLKYSTPERRQAQYEQNVARLEELQNQQRESRSYQPGMNPYLSGESTTSGSPYGAAHQNPRMGMSDTEKEIEQLRKEILLYERGGTDETGFYYGFKAADDYGELRENEDFGALSANRGFQNPSRDELIRGDSLSDSSSWYYDANGVYRDAYGNALETDASGNWVNPNAQGYTVTDRLGLYLSASEEERQEAVGTPVSMEGTWESVIKDGYDGNWELLTKDEIDIYYYLLNSSGQETADKYLADMKVELNRRNTQNATARYTEAFDEANALERLAMSIATTPAQLFSGAAGFIENAAMTLMGKDINPYSAAHSGMNFSNTVRSEQAKAFDEATGGIAIPFIDFTVGDLYQAGMSAFDMAVGGRLGAGAYEVLMGMGSASSEAKRLYEQGASNSQIAWGGALAGAAEMIFEHASIENLINLKNADTVGQLVKNILIQGGIEASEEGFTEIANTITNAIVMGDDSDWAKLLVEHDGDYLAALIAKAQEVGNAAFSGFVSGGIGGGKASVASYAQTQAENKEIGQYISGANSTDALVALAQEMASGASGKDQKRLTAQSDRLGKKFLTEGGKNLATGRLYNTVRSVVTEQNIGEISSALQEKGFSKKDAVAIAGAVAVQANGMELTDNQKKTLQKFESNETVQSVLNEVLGNEESGINQRARSIAKFEFGAMRNHITSQVERAAAVQENRQNADNVDTLNKNGAESSYEVSADGKTILKSTGEIVNVQSIADVRDGQMILRLDNGSTVNAEDVSYSSAGEALVYETVAQMGASVKAANILVNQFKATDGMAAEVFAQGIKEAFRYGKLGIPASKLASSTFASKLNAGQQEYVYRQGQKAAGKQVAKEQATVSKKATVAKNATTDKDNRNYRATLADGISVTSLNESQKASYKLADQIAEAAKVNIRVYAGKTGEHGYYDYQTDEIYLNLNATNKSRKSMMAFTLGHELVHRAKNGSPAKYKAFANFLMEQYGKQESDIEAMIGEELAAAKRFKIQMTYEQAFEEVVCDACERMLLDTNAGQKLAQFGAQSKQNKSFLEDLKRWITEFMDKLRSIFAGVEPNSIAAQEFAKFDESVKKILADMYVDMTIDAGENLSAIHAVIQENAEAISSDEIITDGAVVTDGSEVKYSIKSMKADIAEGQMFEDLKTFCGWTQKQVDELKKNLQDLVEYMTPFRDILDMNETYGREGRRFSPYKPNSDPLYKISMDFSTLCSKRLLTQYVIENLQLRENRPMSAEEQMAIRHMLNEYRKVEKGLQVACAMCYVEAARLKSPKQIQKWMDDPETAMRNYFADKNPEFAAYIKDKQSDFKEARGYARNAKKKDMSAKDVRELNKIRPRLRSQYKVSAEEAKIIERAKALPNGTYLTAANLANLSETEPTIYSAYTAFVRTATRSKSLETDEPYYYGDSRRDNGNGIVVTDDFIEVVNRENGMRFSSWSDWRIQHMLDYITAVIDNSVRGAAMHGYTKFGEEVRVLGKTGMMFNMSGVAGTQTGLNEDGSLSFSPTESIDVNEAIQLREEFPEHAGLQCIGVGDDHIVALLRSDIIDYVIPYHVSGLNAALRRMANIHGWKDYTTTQHAAIDKSKKLEDAVDKEHWHEEPVYSEFFVGYDTGMTGIEAMRASADRYVQMCKDRGLKPKFEQFLKEDNYWKLLIDRKMINQKTGKLIKQKAVTPTFDFDTIKEVVDRHVQNYDSNLEARALNHIVENWDSIPKHIRDLKKQGNTKAKKAADTLANQTLAAQPADGQKAYSLPKVDSDGNQLTEEQNAFFAQSQVRDDQGRLIPMYHGTNNPDFTVFDPQQSDDKISLFFTSDPDVANTYTQLQDKGRDVDPYNLITKASSAEQFNKAQERVGGGLRVVKITPEWIQDMKAKAEKSATRMFGVANKYADLLAYNNSTGVFSYDIERIQEVTSKGIDKLKTDDINKLRKAMGSAKDHSFFATDHKGASREIGRIYSDTYKLFDEVRNYLIAAETPDSAIGQYTYTETNSSMPFMVDRNLDFLGHIIPGTEQEMVAKAIDRMQWVEEHHLGNRYKVYLNITNPYVIDAGVNYSGKMDLVSLERSTTGDGWRVSFENADHDVIKHMTTAEFTAFIESAFDAKTTAKIKEQIEADNEAYRKEWGDDFYEDMDVDHDIQLRNVQMEYAEPGNWNELNFNGKENARTREVAAWAKENGYDGVIFKNMKDAGGYAFMKGRGGSTVVTAFSSEQVKSVDNKKPTVNKDIRYKLPTTQNQPYRKPAYDEWDVSDALDDALDHADQHHDNLIKVGHMPHFISDLLGIEGDFYIYRNHAYENMVSEKQAIKDNRPTMRKKKKIHFHELGKQRMQDAILALENPIMAIADSTEKENPKIVMILPVKGNNDIPLYAAMSFYDDQEINGSFAKKPHLVLTVAERGIYPENGHDGYVGVVNEALKNGRILSLDKEKMRAYMPVIADLTRVGNIADRTLMDNVARFRKEIKSFREKNHIDYKLPVGEDTSPRALLANAFEGVVQNDIEKQRLQEYKGKIDLINAEERKLSELNEKIKELSFAKGPKDTKAIRDLQFEAKQTANRISVYDKQLLRLEASKPLQNVLDREKEMARKRAEQKGKEALAAYREKSTKTQRALMDKWQESRKRATENREKTAMRHKIQNVVGELNNLLLSNDKKHHVPESLKKAVADALALVNMDTVGAEERAAKYANLIAKETDPDKIDAYTVTMENILRQGEKMGQRLKELRDAYEEIQESDDPDIANAYDPVIAGCLRELSQSIGNTSLRNMTIEQLSDVYDMYRMVLTRVRDANKTLLENIKESISNLASRVIGEVRMTGGEHKYRAAILDPVRKFLWNNLKPVYAMEHIGSSTLTKVFDNVRLGEDTWAKDVTEAREYYLDKSRKYGYDTWDFKKKYRFTSASDLEFELTLEQILSLYAYSKREQAGDHLRLGGFVFDSNIETYEEKGSKILKYKVNTADAHQITPEILTEIITTLTSEQMGFVDEMQNYLSTVMGAKGNEVTMKMYGVKLFKEKFYFPLKSAKQFMFEQNEVSGEVRIKNSGFTNKVVAKANNPVILSNFMDVWAGHVNDMSMYHAFVLPLEDFNRVFNYNSPKKENQPPVSVKGTIQNAYSPAAVNYVKNLITDLNGGARSDSTTGVINKMMGMFKKGAVFASASVVVQQPSAIARAAALVDTKYFIGPKVDHKSHKALWDEVKQYAPVAIIKEMGYFDTNMGKSTQDFILGKEYSGFSEKMKALVTDSDYRDEILSKAPALADEIAWCSIWEAVKREMRDKHPGLDAKGEPFLMLAGSRFTEVITKTQVYDSVLARSANMRSKDTGMKMATAFMAEPTTSINMIADALLQGKRGNRKYCRTAIGAVIASQILNAFLVSFVYAARDDDEEESYLEKYIGNFTAKMLEGMNPLTYIPFIKDIVSIVKGYDVERSDMAVISDLWNAVQQLKSDKLSAWRKVEGFVGGICQIFGLPVKNIMRDTRAVWQVFDTIVNGEKTTARGIAYAVKGAITGNDVSNPDQLYESRLAGDAEHAARVEARYDDEDSANAAVRQAIKERFMAGEIDTMTALRQMVLYAGMDASEAHWLMDAWEYRKAMGTDEGYSKYNDFFEAVQTGKNLKLVIKEYIDNGVKKDTLASMITNHFKPEYIKMSASERANIKGYLINALEQCGVDREDAVGRLADWDFEAKHGFNYSDRKEAYLNGEVSASELRTVLIETGGYTEEDADLQIESYDWAAQGYEGATLAAVREYNEHCAAENVPKDVYLYIRSFSNNTENDVDEVTGKTIYYSAMKKVIAEINAQAGLTPAQKTAIARSLGWSEKNINKYKTW